MNGTHSKSERLDLMTRRSDKPVSFPQAMALIASKSLTRTSTSSGEMVIHNMREKRPAYNIINNNCQNFAVLMLDAIQVGAHREFATSFAVYQRATGAGQIKDLFVDKHPEEQTDQTRPELHRHDTVQQAQQVMEEKTTKLDNHHSFFS
jgi:hypothetical protein